MARTSTFDAIVVGNEPAAMMCAGLLQRKRYRVLWIGQGEPVDHYGTESDRLPSMPAMLPPYGHSPALDEVLAELKVEDPVHQLGMSEERAERSLQIIAGRRRIDLSCDPERLRRELERAWPSQSQVISDFCRRLLGQQEALNESLKKLPHLPPESLRDKSRTKRLIPSMQAAELGPLDQWPWLWRMMARAASFYSHLDEHNRSPGVTAHLLAAMLMGQRPVPDLRQQLQKAIAKAGVECEAKILAKELLIEGRQIIGVETTRSGSVFKASVMILGMPVAEVADLVPPKKRRRRFRMLSESVRPQQSVFSVDLVIPASALPLGMGSHVLLAEEEAADLSEERLIQIRALPHPDRRGRIHLGLSCLVPNHKKKLGREYLGPLQQELIKRTASLIPFLEENLEGVTSPFWESRAGDMGHPSPWMLHRTLETDLNITLGMAVLPMPLAYKNLLLCGPEAMPGLGLEGQAQAALQASRWILENRKLKKIL